MRNWAAITNVNKRKSERSHNSKKQKISDQPMEEDGNIDVASTAPVAGTSGGSGSNTGGTMGGVRGQVPLYHGLPVLPRTYTATFTKQYKIRLFNELITYTKVNIPNSGALCRFQYNYHDLPVNSLGLYMSEAEIRRLVPKTEVRVKSVDIQVHNKTAIYTFETNASSSSVGNNNLGIYISQVNPNAVRFGTQSVKDDILVRNVFWGRHATTLPVSITPSTALTGFGAQDITRNYSNKFSYNSLIGMSALVSQSPSTPIEQHAVNISRLLFNRRNASMNEGAYIDWSYQPKGGLIFSQSFITGNLDSHSGENSLSIFQENRNIRHNFTNITFQQQKLPDYPEGNDIRATTNLIGSITDGPFINQSLVGGNVSSVLINDTMIIGNVGSAPILAFGIDPEISITQSTGNVSIVPSHVDFIINTSITLEITEGVSYDEARTNTLIEPDYHNPRQRMYTVGGAVGSNTISAVQTYQQVSPYAGVETRNMSVNTTIPTSWSTNVQTFTAAKSMKEMLQEQAAEDEKDYEEAEKSIQNHYKKRLRHHKIAETKKQKKQTDKLG